MPSHGKCGKGAKRRRGVAVERDDERGILAGNVTRQTWERRMRCEGKSGRRLAVTAAAAAACACGLVVGLSAGVHRSTLAYGVNGAYITVPDEDAGRARSLGALVPREYRGNGQFPEAQPLDPAAGLTPLVYRVNGAFPEAPPPNPAEGLVPVIYRSNGGFPEPLPPNPAAGLEPVIYRTNGGFPEPQQENPAAGLVAVDYLEANGQFPEPQPPNPAAGLEPLAYRGQNGQFPEPQPPNPAAGLEPRAYRTNGAFPEFVENPADGLPPVRYNSENGQAPGGGGTAGELKWGAAGQDGTRHRTSYMPPPLPAPQRG